jgi:hypothetical protein
MNTNNENCLYECQDKLIELKQFMNELSEISFIKVS